MKAGGKAKDERLAVEAGEHDLAARREARDQRVEQRRIAADVADARGSRGASSSSGSIDAVAVGAVGALRDCVSQTRSASPPSGDGEAREQAAEHAMADDEVGQRGAGAAMAW